MPATGGDSTQLFPVVDAGPRLRVREAVGEAQRRPASEPRVRKTIQNMPRSLPPGGRRKRLYPESDAGVAELVDATGLGPVGPRGPWRFKSSRPHCRPDAVRDRGDHREPDGGDACPEDCVPHRHEECRHSPRAASRSFYLDRVISSMRAAARSSAASSKRYGVAFGIACSGPSRSSEPAGRVQRVAHRDLVADDEHRLLGPREQRAERRARSGAPRRRGSRRRGTARRACARASTPGTPRSSRPRARRRRCRRAAAPRPRDVSPGERELRPSRACGRSACARRGRAGGRTAACPSCSACGLRPRA